MHEFRSKNNFTFESDHFSYCEKISIELNVTVLRRRYASSPTIACICLFGYGIIWKKYTIIIINCAYHLHARLSASAHTCNGNESTVLIGLAFDASACLQISNFNGISYERAFIACAFYWNDAVFLVSFSFTHCRYTLVIPTHNDKYAAIIYVS